jgi:SRSO17 transposase
LHQYDIHVGGEFSPTRLDRRRHRLPRAGRYSVGVARLYLGTLSKVGNCQIGVSVSAAFEAASGAFA